MKEFDFVITEITTRAEHAHDAALNDPDDTVHHEAVSQLLISLRDRIVAAHKTDIENLEDKIARLVEMQNPDIQVQKTIALEKRLNKQKAINKNLVDQNAELLADLKRSNEQYQHLVNVKSCEWNDNRKPDLITMCEKLHRAIKDERTAAFAAQTAYATRREIEDAIVDLVGAIIETRIQKEEQNDHT